MVVLPLVTSDRRGGEFGVKKKGWFFDFDAEMYPGHRVPRAQTL
jgi:hypothetical protein